MDSQVPTSTSIVPAASTPIAYTMFSRILASANTSNSFSTSTLIAYAVLILTFAAVMRHVSFLRWRKKLPPGPTGLPIVGNLFQLSEDAWFKFTEWKGHYGDIIYLNLAGQNVVVLNSLQAAGDLLDRKAAIFSSRPRFEVAGNMLTEGLFFVFQSYGDLWRRMRRAAHDGLHSGVVKEFLPVQTLETSILLNDLLASPKRWEEHLLRTAGSTILSVCYDMPPLKDARDPSMVMLHEFTGKIVRAGYVDGYLVEFFPLLKYLPPALAPWKREALRSAPKFTKLFVDFYSAVKGRVAKGDTRPSLAASMVEKQIKYNLGDKEMAWLIATIAAAFETVAGTMGWFMLAMVLYPECQKKAQEELDAVVGRERLPSFADYDRLVYIRAIVKETLRWHPVGPLGMQHRSTDDYMYGDYFIPKGTVCIPNIWAINRDPEIWGPDADEFNPARHIGPDGQLAPSPADTKEEGHVTFGFGRRICVGRHLARNSLFLNMACILWMFNVGPPVDADGKEVMCDEKSIDLGLVVRPQEYDHRFKLRFPEAATVFEDHKDRFTEATTFFEGRK